MNRETTKSITVSGEIVEVGALEGQEAAVGFVCDLAAKVDPSESDEMALQTTVPITKTQARLMGASLYCRVTITITVEEG